MSDFIDITTPGWDLFFPDDCAVSTPNGTATNSLGELINGPVPLADHSAVECALVFKAGKVVMAGDTQLGISTHEIHLRGHYDDVKPLMICTVTRRSSGQSAGTFKVLSAGADSQTVKTILLVEQIV